AGRTGNRTGPAGPGTGHQFGPVRPGNRGAQEPAKKPANRHRIGKNR
ncbi:hypothetical protein A2U01_0061442, partial [Trifolium medium]|nr:hypothetical protein [Trifolium medium]